MQVRDVMTRAVVSVGPDTSARYAAEVLAERGFAALPVLGPDEELVGMVAEVDLLRNRLPADPRLHLRRDEAPPPVPPELVREVMSRTVRTVAASDDIADVARLFVDERLRSVPVVEHGRVAGIVSRRDLLRALVRPDAELRDELLGLVEGYTGEPGAYQVEVSDGVATVRRLTGTAQPSASVEERALGEIARTVGGVSAGRVCAEAGQPQHVPSGGTR